MEKAIALSYSSIIFIHGIGNFTLKNKIIEDIKNNKFVEKYREADVRKYGYGATELFFKDINK